MLADEIREEIEKFYINMENELLMNIAKKLAVGKPMEIDKWDLKTNSPIERSGGVNEWQLERLKELGGLTEENAKIIAKYSGQTIEKVNDVFERAREIGTEVDNDMLEMGIKAGILNEVNPILEDTIVTKILNNAIKETLTTFNTQNNSLLASAGKEYTQIVNNVSAQVLAGTKTTTTAMQEAVTELAQNGLIGFTARNGARWTPEAYTSMVLRANTNNTINNIQEERMKLAGGKYWVINQYAGARPKCSLDQGKVFSIDGSTEPIKDLYGNKIEVRPWSSSSYGQPNGILGINCGHSRHIFIPDFTAYDYKPIDKQENDDLYKEKQQQRLYERTIRNKKREIEMLKEIGAENSYIKQKRKQLSNYRREYLEFLDKTGRTRRSGSEWIGTITMSDKQRKKATKLYDNWKIKNDKIKHQKEEIKKSVVGKFDITKYDSSIVATTKDVVLLPERLAHIKERHPEVEKYIKDVSKIIKNPDMILKEINRENTIWLIKTFDKNVKVTMKLNTNKESQYKNSIIQMQLMRDSEIKRNIKKEKVIKIFDKNDIK